MKHLCSASGKIAFFLVRTGLNKGWGSGEWKIGRREEWKRRIPERIRNRDRKGAIGALFRIFCQDLLSHSLSVRLIPPCECAFRGWCAMRTLQMYLKSTISDSVRYIHHVRFSRLAKAGVLLVRFCA